MNILAGRTLCVLLFALPAMPLIADDRDKVAELMVEEMETLTQMSAFGRQLYREDEEPLTPVESCSVSLELAERGEFRQAIKEASKTIFLGEKKDKTFFVAAGTRNLALAYSYANDLANAERFAKIAIDEYFSEGIRILGTAYKIMGDVRMRQQRYDEALEYYKLGLDSSADWMETLFRASMARAYALTNKFDLAKEHYQGAIEAVKLMNPEGKGRLYGTIGKPGPWMEPTLLRGQAELAYLEGNHDQAISLYDDVVHTANDDIYQKVWGHVGKARVLRAKGDATAAMAAMDHAVAVAESMREQFRSEEFKIGLFSNVQDVFDEAIDMHMEAGQFEQAFIISEKSRARALLDMVRNRVSLSSGKAAFADPQRQVATLQQIQSSLPASTALVVYHSNPKQTYAWVVRKDGIKGYRLADGRNRLANQVRQLRATIRQLGNTEAASRNLYQALIQPLALQKNEQLIIVPHKALHFLPFQALKDAEGYLIQIHKLSLAPSASMLTLKRKPIADRTHLLALGNPKLSTAELDLPGSQVEVETIARLYSSSKIFVREDATRNRVTENGPASQVIHIAAHAVVDEVDPLYSRILLSPKDNLIKNKDLEARDIYHIDLHNTSLVVLSACRSGLGNVAGGDEVMGFTRTFLSAGAANMVVSLWDVEDNSTAVLMKTFHHQAQESDMVSAMQRAQVTVLNNEKTRHPFFWAGFNLISTI